MDFYHTSAAGGGTEAGASKISKTLEAHNSIKNEEQLEEIEVLRSIFDGDESIKFLDADNDPIPKIRYLFGESDDQKSILIEFDISSQDYPIKCGPKFNLDLFYNKNLTLESKNQILEFLQSNIENLLGSPMIFSLIELLKENSADLLSKLSNGIQKNEDNEKLDTSDNNLNNNYANEATTHHVKNTGMSKAQKRRMWDRGEGTGEKMRGWNWVDIIKHLSQGPAADPNP